MIGDVVGNYKIIDKIGDGRMGAVFKAVDLMLEREVAIKTLLPELARQPQIVERFRTEAVTLARLNHPNIAALHSFFRQGNDFFLVMEYLHGETLDVVIRKRGVIPSGQAIDLFCQVLEGLDHAHKMGIVHRDIKSANIMLTDLGSIKVLDFGIAHMLGAARTTKPGDILGTIEYMSPEQVRERVTDARSDIYSLGIVLYEMLTGHVPFVSQSAFDLMRMHIEDSPRSPRAFVPTIPVAVEQSVLRALAKKPEARFQSAGEFRHNLAAKLDPDSRSAWASQALPRSFPTEINNKPHKRVPGRLLPKVFISYKWEDDAHRRWVMRFASDLRTAGFYVFLDEWEVRYGDSFTDYMTQRIAEADIILFIMTSSSVAAVEASEGGGAIKFEMRMATARLVAATNMRLIGIYREGRKTLDYLRDNRYADFRDDSQYDASLKDLIDDLLGKSRRRR